MFWDIGGKCQFQHKSQQKRKNAWKPFNHKKTQLIALGERFECPSDYDQTQEDSCQIDKWEDTPVPHIDYSWHKLHPTSYQIKIPDPLINHLIKSVLLLTLVRTFTLVKQPFHHLSLLKIQPIQITLHFTRLRYFLTKAGLYSEDYWFGPLVWWGELFVFFRATRGLFVIVHLLILF